MISDDDDQLLGENELSSGGRLSVFPNGSLVSNYMIIIMIMMIRIMLFMIMMLIMIMMLLLMRFCQVLTSVSSGDAGAYTCTATNRSILSWRRNQI